MTETNSEKGPEMKPERKPERKLVSSPVGGIDPNVREIHNLRNIKSRTDLSAKQIEIVNKLSTLGMIFGNGLVNMHLNDLMTLNLSKERKSRSELVEAIKSRISDLVDKAKTGLLG